MNPYNPTPADDTPFPDRFAVDALLAGHALGDLDATEREQLAALLLQHPELRQRLEEFQTTLELLPLALPATAPPTPTATTISAAACSKSRRANPSCRSSITCLTSRGIETLSTLTTTNAKAPRRTAFLWGRR